MCHAIAQDESRRGAAVVEEPLAGRRVRVEEAVARLFEHCRDLAGGPEEVAEVVVTVPPYYTFAQRRLLAQTLRLAGLEPLVLVNDLRSACPHALCPQRVCIYRSWFSPQIGVRASVR